MKKWRIPIEIILPVISVIAGLLLAGYMTDRYIDSCKYAEWTSVEATVIDMTSYEESNSRKRLGNTVYVITYSYDVGGVEYEGETKSYTPIQVGNCIEIKCDPESPSISSAATKPDTKGFVIAILLSVALIAIGGFFTVIVWKERDILTQPSENKPYRHERRDPKSYLGLLLPIGVFLLAAVLMHYQPFMQKNISADEFIQLMQSNGYEAEDSLDRLQTEFGMGSIIKRSYSVNTESLRIDFCELDDSHNAGILYDSASLPADSQVIGKKNFTAAEDNDFFYVKAFANNTFVYGACKIELKDELLRLMEDMNYYSR